MTLPYLNKHENKRQSMGRYGRMWSNYFISNKDGNPNPTIILDPKRFLIQIRNVNCGFGLLIFTTFVAFKKNIFTVSLMLILG